MGLYLRILVPVSLLSLLVHIALDAAGRIDSLGLWYLLLSAGIYGAVISVLLCLAVILLRSRRSGD